MKINRFFVCSLVSLISGLATCNGVSTGQKCSSDSENVLQANKIYSYRFRSEALTQAVGTTEDHGRIVLGCDVQVAHVQDCYYKMDLQNCEVTATGGEPGSQTAWIDHQALPDLSRRTIVFTLSNGEIGEVKTHDEDPLYYVNIKRGVLSAFVFKLSQTEKEVNETHTDIHGTCPLTSIPKDGTVKTSKDMLHCRFPSRQDWQFSPWSMFWNMSFIQHVINSTTDCEYKINEEEKRIDKVFCRERHAIMLESTHRTTTAVQTNVFYNMDFVNSRAKTEDIAFPVLTRTTDIRYEYEHTPIPQHSPENFLPIAKKMLSDLVLDSLDEVRLFTITQFTDFVGWLRASHNLGPLVDSVRECTFLPDGIQCNKKIKDLASSYLRDALLQCNNIPCVKGLTYLAVNNELSPTSLNLIFHTWSYMHYSSSGFITNFAELCRLKNSNQCWMSLGNFISRIYSRKDHLNEKIVQEVEEVSSFFYNSISEECEVNEETNKIYTNCLIFLKAAGNIGQPYTKIVPDAVNQFLELATDEYSLLVIRTSALEALKDIYNASNKHQRHLVYDRLLPLLQNVSLPTSIRLLSYDLLVLVSEDYNFEEHLLNILKMEENAEVKYYIADSLVSLMVDQKFRSRRLKFLNSLDELLRSSKLSLEWILYETKGKSKTSSHSSFFNLPFLPDSMKKFGVIIRDAYLHDSSVYPTYVSQDTIFQLFNAILPAMKLGSYFEGWEEPILAYKKNLADMNTESATFPMVLEALMKTLREFGGVDQENLRNFDENIISHLKKIHQLYWEHHKKSHPYAKAYMDLFGSTMKYFVQDDLLTVKDNGLGKLLLSISQNLAEGVTFNTTRVIRVIEAYHQVPTMMGLPLNWTTNATLAFSIRAGLMYQRSSEDNHVHSKGFLQPSTALTFLNRMVLDFPTLTQIGVQANSSGYTSTELKAQYSSVKGKHTLRFDRPSRTQKVLELFRTNQLIKHDKYEDIADWDIERTASSWCTRSNAVSGLKFCLSKSYPNVTHRIKPWVLMAGWCKWQFFIEPSNSNDVHYNMEYQEESKQKLNEYTAKFSITEQGREKAVNFKALVDESGKDLRLDLRTTAMPDFRASYAKSELPKSKKANGYKIEAVLKPFKDFNYEFEYINEGKIQKPSTKISSPSSDNNQILIIEQRFKLNTPYGVYAGNKSIFTLGENTKADIVFSYENKADSGWMRNILPPAYWEDDKKASIKLRLHWKKPVYKSENTVSRQTEFRFEIPWYLMTLNGNGLESDNRMQFIVNLAKTDLRSKKLDAFLNFTYDYWSDRSKEPHQTSIRSVNITVPRRSWSVAFERTREGRKYLHDVRLKRAVMKPIDGVKSDYVGWWSEDVSDRFKIEEREIKLIANHEGFSLEAAELANKYPTVSIEDLANLNSELLVSNVGLYYPLYGKMESLIFEGYFITSKESWKTYRFQKNFNLTSSYNDLNLTSHTVYRSEMESSILYHTSYFTHLTSETRADNTIHYVKKQSKGRCSDLEFQHSIRSHVLDLSTDATYKCESEADNLHTLRLKLNSNSSKWNMLDLNLDQIIEDVSLYYSREEMTATHPLGTVHVDAEWKVDPKHNLKLVTLCSKDGNCPNAELTIESWPLQRVIKFNRNDYELSYRRTFSHDYKILNWNIGYASKVDEEAASVLDMTGELIASNYHVWKGTLNTQTGNKVKEIVSDGYQKFRNAFVEIASDKNHPLNEILQPALKMTLYDYWKSLKAEFEHSTTASWSGVKEIIYTLDAFVEPAYGVFVSTISCAYDLCRMAYDSLKEKSISIWAINYFQLPYYYQESFASLPQALKELWNQLAVGQENVLHFKFLTGKLFAMTSFLEWPSMSFYPPLMSMYFGGGMYFEEGRYSEVEFAEGKMAMLFGPLHVYTFDGHMYDVPEYPDPGCSFLLAHDVHRSLFTVFSSQKGIHLLFPEMSLTIDDHNEVFVNGSQQPSTVPIESSNGKVIVKRGSTVEVWSPSLSVICRKEDFLCILKLSDFHTGGIIGLLGNADGRSKNDFMLPNGNTSGLLEFVRSYEVSGKPECKNLKLTPVSSPSEEETRSCSEKLEHYCLDKFSVRQKFMEACIADVRTGHGTCYTAAGLTAFCHHKNMRAHTDCNFKKQERTTISRNLEVVLIIQESKYLLPFDKSGSLIKGIESLIRAVDDRFKEAGYESIKYSLVGFGGTGARFKPTIHSSQKDIWLPADAMIKDVLKTLEFKSKKGFDNLKAVRYALEELGYDSFDSKVFILITPKDKQVTNQQQLNYLQVDLGENGITLYTISSYPSIEKGKKVFGVRTDGLIFPSQSKEGDAYLDYPRGGLAKLTSSTRGSVFLHKFLQDNRPSAFFEEFAQEVWAKVNKEAQKCRRCLRVNIPSWWWYKNECKIVDCAELRPRQ